MRLALVSLFLFPLAKATYGTCSGCCGGKDDGCSGMQIGDGDCDDDWDCAGDLRCGHDNCGRDEGYNRWRWVNEDKKVFDNTDDCCCRVTSDGGCTTLPEDGEENICLYAWPNPRNELWHGLLMALAVVFGLLTIAALRAYGTHAWSWRSLRLVARLFSTWKARWHGPTSVALLFSTLGCTILSVYYGPAPGTCHDELLVFGHLLLWLGCAIGLMAFGLWSHYRTIGKADEPKSNPERTELPPREEEATPAEEEEHISAAPEAEETSIEQPPPPPARRWFSRAEPEPAASKAEEMYDHIAAWYNEPENAALRATWGAYPDRHAFKTWPGFVAVTSSFLDNVA
jgi:hypothetical protein